MKTGFSFRVGILLSSLCLFVPALAHAHPGHTDPGSFADGFAHPLTGLDHLLAMLAVSLWSAQLGRRAIWLLPVTFVIAMGLGSFALIAVPLPLVESALVTSLLVLGLLVAVAARLPLVASVALVGAFALFHGGAHAGSISASGNGIASTLGMIAVSAVVFGLGAMLEPLAAENRRTARLRWAGVAIAVAGVMLSW